MATISKKAAKRINELLSDVSLYATLGNQSSGDSTGDYYRHAYREGTAIRALFVEFGIETGALSYFTEECIERLKMKADTAFQARLDADAWQASGKIRRTVILTH